MAHEINLPQPPKIVSKDKQPIIQIDGCYPGYGITLANALRRALLSSLPGTAITAFKIKGVDHEFSTVPHIIEDVIQIGLNLKKVRFSSKTKSFDKAISATLKAKGEKEVKAGDIKTPAGLEVVNKDLHIASLSDKKAELDMELFITSGYGYERAQERQKEKLPIGTIALDAIYSPVLRVNYRIEDMRIGERTDFNRIIMEIKTDGSISATEAFKEASLILAKHFDHLSHINPSKSPKSSKPLKSAKPKPKATLPLPKKLADLRLNTKTIKILEKNGIKTVAGLLRKKESSLKKLSGLGERSLSEIKKNLKKFGLSLKE